MDLTAIFEELQSLPPQRQKQAAHFIHDLYTASHEERKAALRQAAGSLSNDEAAELARNIEDGCERVDERGW